VPDAQKIPLSLWLMPAPQFRGELQTWIDAISAEFQSHRFLPHITIVGDVQRSFAETFPVVESVASSTSPISLSLSQLEAEEDLYKSLFFAADESVDLANLQARCGDLLSPVARPKPHLSLAYTDAPRVRRLETAERLGVPDRLPLKMTAESIQIWYTPLGNFELWECLAELKLGV
jgi:2'-5' RNA ligase superfamily